MEFGGRPDGPGGNGNEFDSTGLYARLSSYSTNNKGQRSSYNKKLEMLLRSVAEFITLDADARGDISTDVSSVFRGGKI
jgi:hypothetical protein